MKKIVLWGFAILSASPACAQTTYNYTGPVSTSTGGTLWSNTVNWTATVGTGTTYPGSNGANTTDQANLTDTAANRIITYDTGASGYLGALNLTETSSFNNEVAVLGSANGNTLTIKNSITLGASAGGTSTLFVDSYSGAANNGTATSGGTAVTITAPALTLNARGVLELFSGASSASATTAATLNAAVTIQGGTLNADRGAAPSAAGPAITRVGGNLTMTSGTLNLSAANSLGVAVNATPAADNRLYVTGNLQVTGGTINQQAGGTSTTTSTTLGQSSLYLQGTANYLTGATFNAGTSINLASAGTSQTFYSNVALNNLATSNTATAGTAAAPSYALRTVGAANANGTVNAAGTLTVGQVQFGDGISYNNSAIQLASNTTAKAGSLLPNRQNTTANNANTLDVAGFTYDLTPVLQTAANNNGIVSFTTTNTADNTGFSSNASTIVGTINVTSTVAGGVVKATGFDLSGGGAAGGVNVTDVAYNGAAATNRVTLQSTGGAGTANNLGGSAFVSGTAISATSTFLYSGAAPTTNEATLVSNRTIGMLQVSTGALNLAQASLTTGGAVTINAGGTLDLNGRGATGAFGTLNLATGSFLASNATIELTLGGGNDVINALGAGQSFSLSTVTLALNGTLAPGNYAVFTGFTGTNTLSGVSFSGLLPGETATLSTNGVISISAVPEPSTWALLGLGAAGVGVIALRRRQTVSA